jgi:hypothetical protein
MDHSNNPSLNTTHHDCVLKCKRNKAEESMHVIITATAVVALNLLVQSLGLTQAGAQTIATIVVLNWRRGKVSKRKAQAAGSS